MLLTNNSEKIARCIRLKAIHPFSENLNKWVEQQFTKLPFEVVFVEGEPYADFETMQDAFRENPNRLEVSTLHSEKTIFGDPQVNWKFRAIHDFLHLVHGLDFTYEAELLVNYHQTVFALQTGRGLLRDFELSLLNIETAGQIAYHRSTGEFPSDQRKFAIGELVKMYEL